MCVKIRLILKTLISRQIQDGPKPNLSIFLCYFLPNGQDKAEILCEEESRTERNQKNNFLVYSQEGKGSKIHLKHLSRIQAPVKGHKGRSPAQRCAQEPIMGQEEKQVGLKAPHCSRSEGTMP